MSTTPSDSAASLPADFDLNAIRVASPCHEDWAGMSGDARARFCGACQKNVYNLSEMTRADALALIQERQGNLCVRFYQRADGTVLTADCKVGARRERVRKVRRVAASVAFAAGLFAGGRSLAGDLGAADGSGQTHAALQAAQQQTPACGLVITYTVAAGDTLESIAKTWGTDAETLREMNADLPQDGLQPGRKIQVPMQTVAIKGKVVASPNVQPISQIQGGLAPMPPQLLQPQPPTTAELDAEKDIPVRIDDGPVPVSEAGDLKDERPVKVIMGDPAPAPQAAAPSPATGNAAAHAIMGRVAMPAPKR